MSAPATSHLGDPRFGTGTTWRPGPWVVATAALVTIGAVLVRDAVATPATTWMHMYRPGDFPRAADLFGFLRELRVPIPPAIAAAEILAFQRCGSTDLVTADFYRIALIGAYVLALWLTYPSFARMAASFLASVVFLWATVVIHPANPQVYDIALPFFALGFVTLVGIAGALQFRRHGVALACSMGAGLCLSLTELSRPFVLVLLPLLIAGSYRCLAADRRLFVGLLIPLCVLSGTWHVHLFAAHDQVLASNYSGFNLRRAWPQAPLPEGMYETSTQPGDAVRWPNINTAEQRMASRRLQRVILSYMIAHPVEAGVHAVRLLVRFAAPQTAFYGGVAPPDRILSAYRIVAPASFLFAIASGCLLAFRVLRVPRLWLHTLGSPDSLLLIIACGSLLALGLGEAHEEARLALSLLPLLAAYPMPRGVPPARLADRRVA